MNNTIRLLTIMMFSAIIMVVVSCTSAPVVTITEDDKGKSFTVPEGKNFAVKLKAQLGTGYGWQMKEENPLVSLQGDPKQEGSEGKETGGFEYQVFSFKAAKKGKTDILFHYRQPWNDKVKALKEYKVSVEIQ